ncbi:MAG TPA: phenylalanine--tRNA ligase subunit alpha [bacterium]|nr:phenylalanine--tRNA ligase subunit alpha [bacterium]
MDYRNEILGKNGKLTEILKGLKSLSDEEKRGVGKHANEIRDELSAAFDDRKTRIELADIERAIASEYADVTIPYSRTDGSHVHPLARVRDEIEDVFVRMGFRVYESDEVTTEYANFDAVNVPATHPARDMQDTFWLEGSGNVLATQTSCMQNHILRTNTPPIRAIIPGRVFRNEAIDATHENTFYQVEGMVVDRGIHIGHLKYTLETMLSEIFGKPVRTRMRPGFFPFVEPGVEVDSSCPFCDGVGCRICKQSGWIELVPAGLIHPNVLREGGIDPEVYSGFAFGLGMNRLAMLKYGVDNIRLFLDPDIDFLRQF